MKKIVLVTGASGAFGERLTRALHARDWHVRGLSHRRVPLLTDENVKGSLVDAAALTAAATGCRVVVHAAAATHARHSSTYERVNVDGTRTALAAAHDAAVEHFVFLSTHALSPAGGPYCTSKRRAEELVMQSGLAWTIVRLPELYGASNREGLDGMIDRARHCRRIAFVSPGTDVIRAVHVDDAAAACAEAVEVGPARRTYTLPGSRMTIREFADRCNTASGNASGVVAVPRPIVWAACQLSRFLPLRLYPDQLSRLGSPRAEPTLDVTDLSFAPRTVEEGLRDVFADNL